MDEVSWEDERCGLRRGKGEGTYLEIGVISRLNQDNAKSKTLQTHPGSSSGVSALTAAWIKPRPKTATSSHSRTQVSIQSRLVPVDRTSR
jgi:hypothetical protein